MPALLPLMSVLEQGGKFVKTIKYGCELRGLKAGPPRLPLLPLNTEDEKLLTEVMKTLRAEIAKIVLE